MLDTGSATARAAESGRETGARPNPARRFVLLAPIALIATTYPVFQVSRSIFGHAAGGQLAWFVGMAVYWVAWGWVFSTWVLGRHRAWELIRPRPAAAGPIFHVTVFVALAAAVRLLVPGMAYEKAGIGALLLLMISPFANGLCEELLWRGVFMVAYPRNGWLRVIWPSVMFGLWHLVPGSISTDGPQLAMVVGPTLMGLYLAWLSNKTGTIWWAILAHTLGGLVMIS